MNPVLFITFTFLSFQHRHLATSKIPDYSILMKGVLHSCDGGVKMTSCRELMLELGPSTREVEKQIASTSDLEVDLTKEQASWIGHVPSRVVNTNCSQERNYFQVSKVKRGPIQAMYASQIQ